MDLGVDCSTDHQPGMKLHEITKGARVGERQGPRTESF